MPVFPHRSSVHVLRLGCLLLLLLTGCQSVFYYPSQRRFFTPEMFGDAYEEVTFTTADGIKLHAWYIFGKQRPAQGSVLFFHGNAHNISHYYLIAKGFVEAGYNLLIFDYRGYGLSEGEPSPEGLLADADAAWAYLLKRPETQPGQIVVFAQSLGGSVALDWVGRRHPEELAGVVSESAFSSYTKIVEEKLDPIGVVRIFRKPLAQVFFDDTHAAVRQVERIAPIPLLLVHGTEDPIVPYANVERLFDAAQDPKLLWTIEGGGHIQMLSRYGETYWPRLIRLLDLLMDDNTPDETWALLP